MTADAKYDNKIHSDLCAAITSLSKQNKYAFAPFLSAEERNFIETVTIVQSGKYDNYNDLGNGKQKPSYEDLVTSALSLTKDNVCDDTSAIANLMVSLINKAANQMSKCLNVAPNKLSVRVDTDNECHTDDYKFHKDGGPMDVVKLTLALKGKGTVFTPDQSLFDGEYIAGILPLSVSYGDDVVSAPDLHVSVFTSGGYYDDRAIHSAPRDSLHAENCSRILIVLDNYGLNY